MGEYKEFAEALLGQISIEIDEEKQIAAHATKASEAISGQATFEELESISYKILPECRRRVEEFLNIKIPDNIQLEFLDLVGLKKLKGDKVFASKNGDEFVTELFAAVADEDSSKIAKIMEKDIAKYLVYSTYAIQYISKITTTYGDYLDSVIYLNKFILSRYPQIVLYKKGEPYKENIDQVSSGYVGAIKMTILEELVHSAQVNLQEINKRAALQVNTINERLASIILALDVGTIDMLAEHCQLQTVPDNFPLAKRANLFFFLNPDHFLTEQIGPDVMTYTHVQIDPKIEEAIPEIHSIYTEWLKPIQQHHAAFSVMEGMAGFVVDKILADDADFGNYLGAFMQTDISSYQVRKSMGKDFVRAVHKERGQQAFTEIIEHPPTTRELKDPSRYISILSQM